jgi:hypothetical protein
MTAPTQYLRDLREQQTHRRLGVAKALRESPTATNVDLAKMFGVTRETIALDRRFLMEQLKLSTMTETERLRDEMVTKLDGLVGEVEKHRKDGKLSLSAIDQILSISKSIIELTGIRKPVIEKHLHKHASTIRFQTTIAGTAGESKPRLVELIKEPLTLEAGEPNE